MARYPVKLAPALVSFEKKPLARVLETMAKRWAVLTLEALGNRSRRFNELQRDLDGITHKVLIDTLRSLQRDGFVDGPLTNDGATEYRLTPLGLELLVLVGEVAVWCDHRWAELAVARQKFDVSKVA